MKGYKYKLYSKPHSANNFNKLIHLYKKISHPKYLQQEDRDAEKKKTVIKTQGTHYSPPPNTTTHPLPQSSTRTSSSTTT